jgi:signal transduction histidine kinase
MNVDTEPGLRQADIDPERMEQVLDNLVSNALRFTPEGGRIDLHAYSVKNSLMIEVKDTGKGIPADALHHVFERSYRGDPSRNGDESGLGLAIARSIVELHGGRIEGFSEGPGQGSIFSILIPIK